MDDKTLLNLIIAFKAAPSPALAKVLVFTHLDKGDPESASKFLSELGDDLSKPELRRLIMELSDTCTLALIAYGNKVKRLDTLRSMIGMLRSQNRIEIAKLIYHLQRRRDPKMKTPDLEESLAGVRPRPMLRLVE